MPDPIYLFSEQKSNRLQYVLDFLSEEFFGIEVQIIQDLERFKSAEGLKINYSDRDDLEGLRVIPHGLLFETGVKPFDFSTLENDTFSMIFFLLSRYEEYLPFNADKHGRFPAKESFMFKSGNILIPVVDQTAIQLCNQIKESYPNFEPKKSNFQFINTVDIDQAWQYKNHTFLRTLGKLLKDSLKGKFTGFKVLFGSKKDSYFQFDYLRELQSQNKFKTIFFWLIGSYSEFDKNNHHKNISFINLIKNTNQWSESGLHPSYQSNRNKEFLKEEKQRLEYVLGENIIKSRQHYIQLRLPTSYQNLLQNGFQEDYSMGFADSSGFRAGTCRPFFWYDLEQEKETSLKVFPFCTMDVTMKRYMRLTNQEAKEHLEGLINEVKNVKGIFIPIFHNQNLTESDGWQGWKEIYEWMIEKGNKE